MNRIDQEVIDSIRARHVEGRLKQTHLDVAFLLNALERTQAENERLREERDRLLEIVQDDRWNWHKSCRVCGMMFRKIDGVWVGNHRGWCDFAKVEGGDSS